MLGAFRSLNLTLKEQTLTTVIKAKIRRKKQQMNQNGRTSSCAGTSSSPRHLCGDFSLASSRRRHLLPPALLPLHHQPLYSYASPFSRLLLRHRPRRPPHICGATWASCAPRVLLPLLGCRCGCGGGAWTASPQARVWPWHPGGHERCGGGARLSGCVCSLWTPLGPREAGPRLNLLLHHHRHVRGGVFACGAHRWGGAG